jgi:hypothetical protein
LGSTWAEVEVIIGCSEASVGRFCAVPSGATVTVEQSVTLKRQSTQEPEGVDPPFLDDRGQCSDGDRGRCPIFGRRARGDDDRPVTERKPVTVDCGEVPVAVA